MMYDYLIVGAGLAGSLLGYLLQKNGYNVIILEKQYLDKKAKLCGGIVTPKAYSLLTSHFSIEEIDTAVKEQLYDCLVTDDVQVQLNDIDIKIVDRKKLDDYILSQYVKLGGRVVENCKIQNIDFDNCVITANGEKYSYKYLIGADGVLSFVRKSLTGKTQNKNFALESFQTMSKQLRFTIEFVGNYKGYNWIIPTGKEVCFGTGNIAQETEIEGIFNDLASRCKLDNTKKGAFLPTGNDIYLNKGNIYLIGDAAGLISPITGEGIYYAIYSACILFGCLTKSTNYSRAMNGIVKDIKLQLKLIKIIYNSKIRNFVFKIMVSKNILAKFIERYVKKLLLN